MQILKVPLLVYFAITAYSAVQQHVTAPDRPPAKPKLSLKHPPSPSIPAKEVSPHRLSPERKARLRRKFIMFAKSTATLIKAQQLSQTRLHVKRDNMIREGGPVAEFDRDYAAIKNALIDYKYSVPSNRRGREAAYNDTVRLFMLKNPDLDENNVRQAADKATRAHIPAFICIMVGFFVILISSCFFFAAGPGLRVYFFLGSGVVIFFVGAGIYLSRNVVAAPGL